MTDLFNSCAKGSGAEKIPKLLISGATPHALFESQLQTLQRYIDTNEANHGFKVLAFKDAAYIFSHKGGTNIYFLGPHSYKMTVSKQFFRYKTDNERVPGQNAYYFFVYTAMQNVVSNRSRLGVLSQS